MEHSTPPRRSLAGRLVAALDWLDSRRMRNLVLLLCLAAVVRMAAIGLSPRWQVTDSIIYRGQGQSILQGDPAPRMPNGLPMLEAALLGTVGEAATTPVILAINLVLSVASCWLLFRLGVSYAGPRAAWAATLVMALYPHTLHFVRYELTETFAIFFLLLAMQWLFRDRPLLAGLSMGALWLFRSSLLPAALLPALLLALWPLAGPRLHGAARYLLGLATVWLLHGALVWGGVIAKPENLNENFIWAISGTSTEGIPFMQGTDSAATSRPLRSYVEFAMAHPAQFAKQRLSSLWELVGPWPSPGIGDYQRGKVTRALIGLRFVLLLLALGAAWRLRRRQTAYLFMPLLGIAALHVVFFSEPRFLAPAEPMLMLLAAAFLLHRRGPETASPDLR